MYVIRASKIGHPCIRNIWYSSVGGIEEPFSKETLRIFEVGTILEKVVVGWLREDGWEVYHNEGSQEAEWEIEVEVKGGVIKGHPDCIITRDGISHLGDVKTMNSRAFKLWYEQGTLAKYPQYYQQLHPYTYGAKLDSCAIIGMCKDTSQYKVEILPYSEDVMHEIMAKAEFILGCDTAPMPDTLPNWACNYCGYKRMGVCPGFKGLEGME